MSLSFEDAGILRSAGFTEWEIAKLAEGTRPDGTPQDPVELNKPMWLKVLKSREEWIADKIERGWSAEQIEDNISSYYARSPKRSPFDFLKAEYKPVGKRDFWAEIRHRAQNKVKASLKGYRFSTKFE